MVRLGAERRVALLGVEEEGEVVHGDHGLGVVLAERLLAAGEGSPEKRFGFVRAAEAVRDPRQVVHHRQGPLVLLAELALLINVRKEKSAE